MFVSGILRGSSIIISKIFPSYQERVTRLENNLVEFDVVEKIKENGNNRILFIRIIIFHSVRRFSKTLCLSVKFFRQFSLNVLRLQIESKVHMIFSTNSIVLMCESFKILRIMSHMSNNFNTVTKCHSKCFRWFYDHLILVLETYNSTCSLRGIESNQCGASQIMNESVYKKFKNMIRYGI